LDIKSFFVVEDLFWCSG